MIAAMTLGMEVVIERPDASRVPVLVNIAPLFSDQGKLIGAVNCFQDLSAHRRAEHERARLAEELHQAKKMEAVGEFAAGIVNEFNNLFTASLGNLGMLAKRTNESLSLKLLHNTVQTVERGERLIQQLRSFTRKQKLSPKAVDLNQVLTGMGNLLQTSIGNTIHIEVRKQPGLWPALIDPNEIELALLNLALHARDSMPRGGTLRIETGNATLRGSNRPGNLPAGEYAVVSVSDTGTGISDGVRTGASEPFFTAKEADSGMGFRLSMVVDVARQSGGDVRIANRAVEGTSIEVYLPRANGPSPNEKAEGPGVPLHLVSE
jgi:signal transduction histidine kinase